MDLQMTVARASGNAPVHQPQTVSPSMLLNRSTKNTAAPLRGLENMMPERNENSSHIHGIPLIDMTNSDSEDQKPSTKPTNDKTIKPEPTVNDIHLPRSRIHALSALSRSTGVCYDARMRQHFNPADNDNEHPEEPDRITAILEAFVQAGLLKWTEQFIPHQDDILQRIRAIKAGMATICLVHDVDHLKFIRQTKYQEVADLLQLSELGDSVYYNQGTFLAASVAAGGAVACCKAVVSGEVKNAIAVIRPPGHHADPDKAQGFCIFNNVAIAAKVCQTELRDTCRKILIFDWDVHHGNGTQNIFYEDPNVLYMSIHVYLDGEFYPNLAASNHKHTGKGAGAGKNVNVPWSLSGMGNAEYMYAFHQVIMPIAWEFNPDLVIISAGFDAAEGDTMGGCFVTPACYAQMTHALMSLANGKVVVCLEVSSQAPCRLAHRSDCIQGGYNLRSIAQCSLAVTKTLMGEAPDRVELNHISKAAMRDVQQVMRTQSRHWKCLGKYQEEQGSLALFGMTNHLSSDFLDLDRSTVKGERLHGVIQTLREHCLYKSFGMISLPVFRKDMAESLKNQVLVTKDWRKDDTLLVIMHDPAELSGHPDPLTGEFNMFETRLAGFTIYPTAQYIAFTSDWGRWGVMDVSVPKHLADVEDEKKQEQNPNWRVELAQNLLVYLWDNYIQLSEAKKLLFLGVDIGHHAIMHLLQARDCKETLSGVAHFIDHGELEGLGLDATPEFKQWYYDNSLIYMPSDHKIWAEKTPTKRYGQIKQSSQNTLNGMLYKHREEFIDWAAKHGEYEDWETSSDED
ncbi:MAG: Histone deacetylase hda1 [Peltula sp. TS41687]|nr:MAG: Histone deacetylase hda1 [Peltula sp. TS41687]